MGCNCKKLKEFEDTYGTEVKENIFQRTQRAIGKIALFFLILALFVIISPIMFVVIAYKMSLGKNTMITLPSFLTQGFNNGKKLQNTH